MINNFFINLLLLISAIFLAGHLCKDKPSGHMSSLRIKIILGMGTGLLGIGMMTYTIMIQGTSTIIDLRIVALMIAYFVGGVIPTVVTGIAILVFRVLYYGISQSALMAVLQILLLIPSYCLIDRMKLESIKRWGIMYLVSIFIQMSTLYYLLNNVSNVFKILFILFVFSSIAVFFVFNLLQYVCSSNELYRRYKSEASKDFLTGLSNPRKFNQVFNESLEKAKEKNEKLSCLMIDIDHFKKINDTYGHAAGDIVLRDIASILKSTCRDFDVISRLGGEEFCALLMDCSIERAVEIGKLICNKVKNHKFDINEDRHIYVTVSIGASTYPDTIVHSEKLLRQADDLLYKAKETGRNKVCTLEKYNF